MRLEQVELVLATTARLRPELDEVADDFYSRLFTARPDLRALFPDDLTEQRHKFALELDAITGAIPDFERFRKRAEELGERHRGYGVRPSYYAPLREALLAALAEADPAWDEETASAWRAAFNLVAEVMQSV